MPTLAVFGDSLRMWWMAALGVLVALFFWPTNRRRVAKHLSAAQRAADAQNWVEFDRQIALARPFAEAMAPGDVREQLLGEIELATAQDGYRRGNLETAGRSLSKAVEHIEQASAPNKDVRIAKARHLWGEVEFDQGNVERAANQFRAAAQALEYGEQAELSVFSLQRLGDVLLELEKFDEAREVYERCAGFERRIVGEFAADCGEPPPAQISMCVPDLAFANQDYARAEQLFQEKVDYWSRTDARSSEVDLTRFQFLLAEAQQRQGKFSAAVGTLESAVRLASADFGADHPRTERARQKLAEAARQTTASPAATA